MSYGKLWGIALDNNDMGVVPETAEVRIAMTLQYFHEWGK